MLRMCLAAFVIGNGRAGGILLPALGPSRLASLQRPRHAGRSRNAEYGGSPIAPRTAATVVA